MQLALRYKRHGTVARRAVCRERMKDARSQNTFARTDAQDAETSQNRIVHKYPYAMRLRNVPLSATTTTTTTATTTATMRP